MAIQMPIQFRDEPLSLSLSLSLSLPLFPSFTRYSPTLLSPRCDLFLFVPPCSSYITAVRHISDLTMRFVETGACVLCKYPAFCLIKTDTWQGIPPGTWTIRAISFRLLEPSIKQASGSFVTVLFVVALGHL